MKWNGITVLALVDSSYFLAMNRGGVSEKACIMEMSKILVYAFGFKVDYNATMMFKILPMHFFVYSRQRWSQAAFKILKKDFVIVFLSKTTNLFNEPWSQEEHGDRMLHLLLSHFHLSSSSVVGVLHSSKWVVLAPVSRESGVARRRRR